MAARCAELIAAGTPAARDRRAVPDQRAVRRRTRRRWPRPACPTWCRAPSGSSSGPRCARRWWRCGRRPGPRPTGRRCARRWSAALEAVGWRPDAPPGRRRRPGAVGGAGRAGRPGRGVRRPRRRTLAEFGEELARRAALQHAPTVDGVTLACLHSAKGLEWDAVFLVGLVEGMLPTTYARTPDAVEEERRLLYVGITRARQWLTLSYAAARSPGGRQRRPSRFLPLAESGPGRPRGPAGDARRRRHPRRRRSPCRAGSAARP